MGLVRSALVHHFPTQPCGHLTSNQHVPTILPAFEHTQCGTKRAQSANGAAQSEHEAHTAEHSAYAKPARHSTERTQSAHSTAPRRSPARYLCPGAIQGASAGSLQLYLVRWRHRERAPFPRIILAQVASRRTVASSSPPPPTHTPDRKLLGGGGAGGESVCPARYFCAKYLDLSPSFTLP